MSESITREQAVEATETWLKANLGKKALPTPKGSKYRVMRVLRNKEDEQTINVVFQHQGDEGDAAILGMGQKAVDALVAANPALAAFKFNPVTLRY